MGGIEREDGALLWDGRLLQTLTDCGFFSAFAGEAGTDQYFYQFSSPFLKLSISLPLPFFILERRTAMVLLLPPPYIDLIVAIP